MQQVLPTTADMSALVQQLLLSQDATYASKVDERTFKEVSVLLRVPPVERYGRQLPAGDYLVVPWDVASPSRLELYFERLIASGTRPMFVVLITSQGSVDREALFELGERFATEIAAIDVANEQVHGSARLRDTLVRLFDPNAADNLEWVNPLSHMTHLADPRDPGVFFERLQRASPNAGATKLLIGVNLLVFGLMKLSGGTFFGQFDSGLLVQWGANVGALTVGDEQTWRLLSCTFLHADLLHIGFNMYALKVLGDTAERLFRSSMFAALYFLSALGGSVASLAFTLSAEPMLPSVGASGAVFGLMGGLLGFAIARRNSVPPQVFRGLTRSAGLFIVINVAIGFAVSFIDNAAHLGGLGVGIVAGMLLSRDLPPAQQPSTGSRGFAIAAVLFALVIGYYAAASGMDPHALRAGM